MSANDDGAGHRHLRESLGAWVLGALDGRARREVEEHVAACAACADEVAALSPLPGLLNRLSAEEVVDGSLVPSERLREGLTADREREESRLRRRLARWRIAAVAAAALAVVAGVVAGVGAGTGDPGDDGAPPVDRVVAAARPVVDEAVGTDGQAAALAWEWGTTVELDVTDLPVRETYQLWAVAEDGTRERAGTWGTTTSRDARVRGASSIQQDDLARLEVTDATGTVLVRFAFVDDRPSSSRPPSPSPTPAPDG